MNAALMTDAEWQAFVSVTRDDTRPPRVLVVQP